MKRLVKELSLQAALIVLVLMVIFPGVFFEGHILAPASYVYDYAPWSAHVPPDLKPQNPLGSEVPAAACLWYSLTQTALENGDWPLWNPLQFTGAPLIANFQTAVFYPPRLLFTLFGDTLISMTVYILLRFWLCGFNAFICARASGLSLNAARFFSVAYMLVGYNLLWCFYPPPDVMAWFPILFLGTERMLQARYRIAFVLIVLSAVMMILPGHPSSLLICCLGLALYGVTRLFLMRSSASHVGRCAAVAFSAFLVALFVCAVQLLPFLEYLPRSALFIDLFHEEGVGYYTYALRDLLSLWAPRMLGTELEGTFWGATNHTYLGMLYAGIPVWIGVLLLLSPLRLRPRVRSRVRALLATSAICLYFSTRLPGADLIQNLPLLSGVRPAYFVAFPALAFPLAAADGFQAWCKSNTPARLLARPALAALIISVSVAAGFMLAPLLSSAYVEAVGEMPGLPAYILRQGGAAILFAALSLLVMVLAALRAGRLRAALPLLTVLLIVDQGVGITGLLGTSPRRHFLPPTAVVDFLRSQGSPMRVRSDVAGIAPGYLPLCGIEELFGYDAVYPERFRLLMGQVDVAPGSPGDCLTASPYVLLPPAQDLPPGYVTALEAEGLVVAHNTRAMPRARVVGEVRSFPGMEEMVAAINQPGFDPSAVVYADVPVSSELKPGLFATPPGEARIVSWDWQAVEVMTTTRRKAVLVLSDLFYPGWRATVDGAAVNVFPAYGLFRGVVVDAGEHKVVFEYNPPSFRWGLAISTAMLSAAAAAAVVVLARAAASKTAARASH